MNEVQKCPHEGVPFHACLDGTHQCGLCGGVGCHTVACTANPEVLPVEPPRVDESRPDAVKP